MRLRALRLLVLSCASLFVATLPAASATGTLTLASVAPSGAPGNGLSDWPALSADGRLLAFTSIASNLVPGDTNRQADAFLRDLRTGRTTRIGIRAWVPRISGDGRLISYCRGAPGAGQANLYVYDRVARSTVLVSADPRGRPAPTVKHCVTQVMAQGGRYILFWSDSSRLVRHDTNDAGDVFVRDLKLRKTRLVATNARGVHASDEVDMGGISADGRYVVFCTTSQNLLSPGSDPRPEVYLKDLKTGALRYVSATPDGRPLSDASCVAETISPDGRWAAFSAGVHDFMPGVENVYRQLWLKDLRTGRVQLVTAGVTGQGIHGPEGYYDFFSGNGRYLVYISDADDIVHGVWSSYSQVYLYDRVTRKTELVSARPDGTTSGSHAIADDISADGKVIAFASFDEHLVPNDGNDMLDVFVLRR
jgi:Tol biopolymer transport system component